MKFLSRFTSCSIGHSINMNHVVDTTPLRNLMSNQTVSEQWYSCLTCSVSSFVGQFCNERSSEVGCKRDNMK